MSKVQFGVLAGLLAVIAALQAAPVLITTRWAPRYGYQIKAFKDADILAGLADLGDRGWEVVSARRAISGEDGAREAGYEFILKRPM